MTPEEIQLLLKDLCARLPYGVNILADIDQEFDGGTYGVLCRIEPYVGEKHPELKGQFLVYQQGCLTPLVIEEVRPYLRPMSSITEEEHKELTNLVNNDSLLTGDPARTICLHCGVVIDFHNKHYLDWRGLIPMGLALEAKEGMYKIK